MLGRYEQHKKSTGFEARKKTPKNTLVNHFTFGGGGLSQFLPQLRGIIQVSLLNSVKRVIYKLT